MKRSRTGRSRIDLVAIWVLAVVGLLALVVSAGVVLDENLRAYALCAEASRTMCSDWPWFSSMGLAFFGGIVVVTTGFFLGLRRYGPGRIGAWFPLAAIGAVAALTGIATVILLITTPL